MLNAVTAAARAAAPHVGSAVVTGGKSLAGFAVSVKAGQWAKEKGFSAMIDLDTAVGAGRDAAYAVREQAAKSKQEV